MPIHCMTGERQENCVPRERVLCSCERVLCSCERVLCSCERVLYSPVMTQVGTGGRYMLSPTHMI